MGSLNDHSRIAQSRLRIKRVIYTIAHFCALSNPFRKIFRFFFEHAPDLHRPRPRRNSIAFEENTCSFSSRYHIKYTRIQHLSSRFQEKNQKKWRHDDRRQHIVLGVMTIDASISCYCTRTHQARAQCHPKCNLPPRPRKLKKAE